MDINAVSVMVMAITVSDLTFSAFRDCPFREYHAAVRTYGANVPYYCQGAVFPGDEEHYTCSETGDDCFENDDICLESCPRMTLTTYREPEGFIEYLDEIQYDGKRDLEMEAYTTIWKDSEDGDFFEPVNSTWYDPDEVTTTFIPDSIEKIRLLWVKLGAKE